MGTASLYSGSRWIFSVFHAYVLQNWRVVFGLYSVPLRCFSCTLAHDSTAVGALFAWLACCFVENPGQLYPTLIGQLPLFFMGSFLGGCLPSLWIPGILAGMTTLVLYGLGCPEYWIVTAASVGVFVMVFYLGQLLLFCGPFLQKALHWLSRRCFGVFLVHHLAITLVIVPVLVNHRVTPLYWVSGLLLLTVGSFVISFLLDGLSRSIIKFLAESVVT